MLRVLICSHDNLFGELSRTLVGRDDVDRLRATKIEEVRLLATTMSPAVILVDRDLPRADDLIRTLREEPATRTRSVAILARGDLDTVELELMACGANAILRLPPEPGWDERLSKLLNVSARTAVRLPVLLSLEANVEGKETAGEALNLSLCGMLVESPRPLELRCEIGFRFRLEDGGNVAGRGHVIRRAGERQYGVEFHEMGDNDKDALRRFIRSARIASLPDA